MSANFVALKNVSRESYLSNFSFRNIPRFPNRIELAHSPRS